MTEIKQLLLRLSSPDEETAEAAMARLAILGPKTVEPLLELYRGSGDVARQRMLRLLERVPDRRAQRLLAEEVRSDSPGQRRLAVRALATQPDPRALSSLPASLARELDADVREEMVAVLARRAAKGAAELLDPILDILFDGEEPASVRRAALAALPGLPQRDIRRLLQRLSDTADDPLGAEASLVLRGAPFESAPGLAEALAGTDAGAFQESALRLMRLGLKAVPSVLKTMEEHVDDPETARRCAWTLGGMDLQARRGLAQLLDADWHPAMLERSLAALSGLEDRRTAICLKSLAEKLARRASREPDPERTQVLSRLRARCHHIVATGGSRLAIADLKEALRQVRPVPVDLVRALGRIGIAEDLGDLLATHADGDPWLQDEISRAVGRIGRREGNRRLRRAVRALPRDLANLMQRMVSLRPSTTPAEKSKELPR